MSDTVEVRSVDAEAVCEWAKDFHLYREDLQHDPFPALSRLRTHCPVAHSDVAGGFWVFSRYEDVHYILQHPDAFSNTQNIIPWAPNPLGPAIPANIDPPDHAKYRQILSSSFAPAAIDRIESEIRTSAVRLLEAIDTSGPVDFLEAFAVPYPCHIFCAMFGVDLNELPMLLDWKDRLLRDALSPEPGVRERTLASLSGEMSAYFQAVFEERRGQTDRLDLLSVVANARFGGERSLSMSEFINIARLLLTAGLDTVTAQLALATAWLAEHPAHQEQLRDDRTLAPGAAEEFMRHQSLVSTARLVTAEVEVGGQRLVPGDRVMILMGAADRDERQFPSPNEVDFRRAPNRHLGFGAGPHRCIGSHLARRELIVALEEIHRVLPVYALDADRPVVRRFGSLMGVDQLVLRFP